MEKCPDCGWRLSDSSFFCPNCGVKVKEPPSEITALIPSEEERQKPMQVTTSIIDFSFLRSNKAKGPRIKLPFSFRSVENQYGSICYAEAICDGVYHIATGSTRGFSRFGGEYIIVTEDSPAIPPAARAYGTLLPTTPNVLLYDYNDYFDKGRHVVEYEAHRYLAKQGLPLPGDSSLIEDKVRGMEVCPEYFGEFPVPGETPWGQTFRHDRLSNGLYWLETETVGWVLAAAYPLCDGLSDEALALAVLMDYDRENGIDNTCGYRFFTYETSCIPIFELLNEEYKPWANRISMAALKNAILESFPEYADMDAQSNPDFPIDEQILSTPDAGIQFYHFL